MTALAPPTAAVMPSGALWRALARLPRPWLPVDLSRLGGPSAARVVAPLPDAEADALDSSAEHGEARGEVYLLSRAALALCDDSGRRHFRTWRDIAKANTASQCEAMLGLVAHRLDIIAPVYMASDAAAWQHTLTHGAREPANRLRAWAMVQCIDGPFRDGRQRPDRFFGAPVGNITDGQLMAYAAARKAHGLDA